MLESICLALCINVCLGDSNISQISGTNDLACLSEARRSCRQRLVPRAMRALTKHNCCSTRHPHIWFTRTHATMEMRLSSNRLLPLTFISLPVNKRLALSFLNVPLILGPLIWHATVPTGLSFLTSLGMFTVHLSCVFRHWYCWVSSGCAFTPRELVH